MLPFSHFVRARGWLHSEKGHLCHIGRRGVAGYSHQLADLSPAPLESTPKSSMLILGIRQPFSRNAIDKNCPRSFKIINVKGMDAVLKRIILLCGGGQCRNYGLKTSKEYLPKASRNP